jgi:hypothetical protein
MGLRAVIVLVGLILTGAGLRLAHPAEQSMQSLAMDRLGATLRYPDGWSATLQDDRAWVVNAPLAHATGEALNGLAQVYVIVEHRIDHADAIRRLRAIASEYEVPVEYLTIDGWPAMQRRVFVTREQPGAAGAAAQNEQVVRITTAIAAGDLLIRAEGGMPPNAGEQVEQQVRAIESGITFRTAGNAADADREVQELRAFPRLPPSLPPPSEVVPSSPSQQHGKIEAPQRILLGALTRSEEETKPAESKPEPDATGNGVAARVIQGQSNFFASEPEIAVSTDGQNIVVAQGFSYATSNDGGLTFPTTGGFPAPTDGDSSVAYGKSGNFYEGTIAIANSSTALNVSTDGGRTFTFRTNAFTCPMTGMDQCGFRDDGKPHPDQEHIAADRFHTSASGDDEVYFTWRLGGMAAPRFGIACSTNSGQNFGAPNFTTGDFPRITVGQDGFVYVVYVNSGQINLIKYSSCQGGLTVQGGFPLTQPIASGISVTCPVPGLDRCNDGNLLSGHTVAVDDTDPNYIYVAYAQSSGTGESVVLQYSDDGGATWSSSHAATLSASSTARRFMPWLCTVDGLANVTWYDRRAATTMDNDLTDYYGATACVTISDTIHRDEFQINTAGSADAQCRAGSTVGSPQSWLKGSRAPADSICCSQQPELGGKCKHSPNNPGDSNTPCNMASAAIVPQCPTTGINNCPKGETCQTDGGGPKYGDYNGNACAAGRLYSVWASGTPPPGQTATGHVDLYFQASSIGTCCGQRFQSCCRNGCAGGLTCSEGKCSCGGPGQSCCRPGNTCTAGLTCAGTPPTVCVSDNSDCAKCTQTYRACINGCSTDANPNQCKCNCGNSESDCIQAHSCGPWPPTQRCTTP